MKISKTTLLLLIGLIIAMGASIKYYLLSQELTETLKIKDIELTQMERSSLTPAEVTAIDSLLRIKKYGQAIQKTRMMMLDSTVDKKALALRLNMAEQMYEMRSAKDTMQSHLDTVYAQLETLKEMEVPTVVTRIVTKPTDTNVEDSLSFALEKSRLRSTKLQEMLKSQKDDYLTFTSKKGNTIHYVGDVKNGQAYGQGVGLLSTGSRYEGSWKMNQKHGIGIFHWKDGARYEGTYFEDKRHGQGTYHWPNGDKYVGSWENDNRHGEGTFFNKAGKVIARGMWKNDEFEEG